MQKTTSTLKQNLNLIFSLVILIVLVAWLLLSPRSPDEQQAISGSAGQAEPTTKEALRETPKESAPSEQFEKQIGEKQTAQREKQRDKNDQASSTKVTDLPDDLKRQLEEAPRELPPDIKQALETPPRIVPLPDEAELEDATGEEENAVSEGESEKNL